MRGRIAERIWTDEREAVAPIARTGAVLHAAFPISDQSAYQIASPGLEGEIYQPGDLLIVVPFAEYRARPNPGDLIVVRRQDEKGRVSYGLRKAVRRNGDVALVRVLQGGADNGQPEAKPFALVISFQRHLAPSPPVHI